MRKEFTIEVVRRERVVHVAVVGSIHLLNTERFQAEMHALDDLRGAVAFDLSRLDYLDSNALVALLSLRERYLQSGSPLVIVAPSPFVRKLLEITRLVEMMPIHDSVEAVETAVANGVDLRGPLFPIGHRPRPA